MATSPSHTSMSRNNSGKMVNSCETYSKIFFVRYQLETKDKFLSLG